MKQNQTKQIVTLGITLSLYCIIAALALSVTYSVTLPQIQLQQKKATEESMKSIYPDAISFTLCTDNEQNPIFHNQVIDNCITLDCIYEGRDQTNLLLGYLVKGSSLGYGGPIVFIYGLDLDDTIHSVSIIEHSETPGLGANVIKDHFLNQFKGKLTSDAFLVKQDITPITASTITSKALSEGIKKSVTYVRENITELTNENEN
ncbi:MAG: RnfABCDGE type electron transport complex subunit G [Caldisericia bacterium]|nr:RnfABCDGE type electron transport complex subunit G [Caldisericia bacterium]MDD4614467.1 RnfABCDGE type electron transport complex subunit G [Caldisericia bacterium]